MKRIYVAGGMSDHYLFQFEAFDRARDALLALGWDVVSPADLDRADGYDPLKNPDSEPLEYEFCMERDEEAIGTCSAMCFLPGWETSKGAQREKQIAEKLRLEMYRVIWKRNKLSLHPMETGGLRLDDGKPRVELVPPSTMLAVAEVLGASAEPRGKYPVRNWEKGMPWSKSYAPAMRHFLAWWGGEDKDPESGMPHLWHALTDVAFLVEWERTSTGEDDRPKGDT